MRDRCSGRGRDGWDREDDGLMTIGGWDGDEGRSNSGSGS